MKRTWLCFGVALLACVASAVSLDKGSQIVIPDKANIQEQYAASELSAYLGKVFKTPVSTVPEGGYKGGTAIFLGETKLAAAKGYDNFAVEEYQIEANLDKVIIAGNRFRGVLYGTYDFLERFAGVRFFTPQCERIPQRESIEVTDGTNIRHKPAFDFRQIYASDKHRGWSQAFRAKLRCNASVVEPKLGGGNDMGTGGGCHTYYKYSMDFPKEISWMNSAGERVIVTQPYEGSICFSQPEVLERFTVRLKSLIAGDRVKAAKEGCPPPVFYSVQQNDCDATCYCPECLAFKKKHGLSGLVLDFSNRLADAIKDEYPDVYILIFAYFDTLEPPISDIRPRPNVLPQITTYTQRFHDHLRGIDEPVNKVASDLLDRWDAISEHLSMWDYWRYYGGAMMPSPHVKDLAGLMKKYRKCGMIHVFVEYELSNKDIMSFFDLNSYVGYKLMDNPDLDQEELIDDFMAEYYGAAARPMKQYLDLLHVKFKQCGSVAEQHIPPSQRKYLNDAELYEKGFALFADAESAVKENSLLLSRVHAEKLILLSSYVKVLARKGNPLKLDVSKLQNEIEQLCPEVAELLLSAGEKTPMKLKEMQTFLAEKVNFKPTQNIKAKPMDVIPAEGAIIYGIDKITSCRMAVDDAASPEGKGFSLATAWTPEKNAEQHNREFTYGMYEKSYAYYVASNGIAKNNIPQDEKYHWYHVGETCMHDNLLLYLHWSWYINAFLGRYYNPEEPSQMYDVYILMKFQGPAYVKNSNSINDVRFARLAMVKK